MRRVRVRVGRVPYDVLIGSGVLSHPQLRRCLGKKARGVMVSSAPVMKRHGAAIRAALDKAGFEVGRIVLLPDGERAKTARVWERTIRAMAKSGLDRSSFVVAAGGGSIGDAAGFAAATFMRGVRLIQIPTTLLSMVDSSVGGKTGLNLVEGKNLVGAFHQPSLVLADLDLLATLPARERQSGVYEILKCGLLRDAALLGLIERTRGLRQSTGSQLEEAVAAAVRVKARIVERDERESGERVLLNLGHTLGHALEAATAYRGFTHGEAVGHGMEFVVDLSERLGLATGSHARRMRDAIRSVGPKKRLSAAMAAKVSAAALGDKKRDGLELKEILLAGPARPRIQRINALTLATLMGEWVLQNSRALSHERGRD
ncbi:MAG: 3-dehydroquinate synthase [Vicinamibacteria bacterium]